MAGTIAVDATSNGTGATATTISWSHTCSGLNRLLIVSLHIGSSQGDDVSGITYDGVSLTRAGTLSSADGYISLWYLVNPNTGTHTITTTKGTSGFHRGSSTSYTGVYQASPIDTTTSNTASSVSSITTTLTTGVQNCWVCKIAVMNPSATMAAGTNTHLRNNVGGDGAVVFFDSNGSRFKGSNSLQATYVSSRTTWSSFMMSFKPLYPIRRGFFI